MVKLVGRFDATWAEDLRRELEQDEQGSRLNALLGIRNDIAHGRNQGVSRRQIRDYLAVVDKVVTFVLDRFEPEP